VRVHPFAGLGQAPDGGERKACNDGHESVICEACGGGVRNLQHRLRLLELDASIRVESYNSVAELRVFFHAGVDFGDHCFGCGGFSPELLHCIVKALHFFRVTIPEFFLQITVELLCCTVKDLFPGSGAVGHDDVCVLPDGNDAVVACCFI